MPKRSRSRPTCTPVRHRGPSPVPCPAGRSSLSGSKVPRPFQSSDQDHPAGHRDTASDSRAARQVVINLLVNVASLSRSPPPVSPCGACRGPLEQVGKASKFFVRVMAAEQLGVVAEVPQKPVCAARLSSKMQNALINSHPHSRCGLSERGAWLWRLDETVE